jgi:uncharacterized protein (TIGR02145 family)
MLIIILKISGMKTKIYLIAIILILEGISFTANSQGVSINEDGSDPDPTAVLDLQSANKGLLVPRMAYNQITDIQNPANGLIVFNTTDNKYYAYLEGENAWKEIAYGTSSITPFVCGGSLYDYRDGQSYTTVDINGQCWMAENLNIGAFNEGPQQNDGVITKSCQQNNPANCDIYGGLYQWSEMMEYTSTEGAQGICPDGWHVPTDSEWFQMENFLDPAINNPNQVYWRGNVAGGSLKEIGLEYWLSPNTGATNISGFTALGGAYRSYSGAFYQLKRYANFWTSSSYGTYSYFRKIDYNRAQVYRGYGYRTFYFSVRCIKN